MEKKTDLEPVVIPAIPVIPEIPEKYKDVKPLIQALSTKGYLLEEHLGRIFLKNEDVDIMIDVHPNGQIEFYINFGAKENRVIDRLSETLKLSKLKFMIWRHDLKIVEESPRYAGGNYSIILAPKTKTSHDSFSNNTKIAA